MKYNIPQRLTVAHITVAVIFALSLATCVVVPVTIITVIRNAQVAKFWPYAECCSEQEIANHAAACKLFDEAEASGKTPTPEDCPSGWIYDKDGKPWIHVLRAPYGIGTYEYDDGEPDPEPTLNEAAATFGMPDQEMSQFLADRREALMSLDRDKILAYMKKYGVEFNSKSLTVFWIAIHKAITGATDLPLDFREKSKAWLTERGYESFDDGELGRAK